MRIICKTKDYYDFLVGEFGFDPTIVFVRNPDKLCNSIWYKDLFSNTHFDWYHKSDIIYAEIGNKLYTFIYKKGFDLPIPIDDKKVKKENELMLTLSKSFIKERNFDKNSPVISIKGIGPKYNWNKLDNCVLDGSFITKYIKPKEAYQNIYDFLSKQKDLQQNIKDNRTNKEKILSNGFDPKTSFRKM